jgi:hypothetical protein
MHEKDSVGSVGRVLIFYKIYNSSFKHTFVFVFVLAENFGRQHRTVEQTLRVCVRKHKRIGYETGFEHKSLCLCR